MLFGVRAYGLKNIPKKGGAILASNHQSFLDPVLVAHPLERQVHFMARDTLFRSWGFGWLIRNLNALPFRRSSPGKEDIYRVLARLKDGELVLLFPEGTRSRDGEVGRFRRGVVSIALRAGVSVVPVAIEGAFRAWPRGRRMFRFGRLAVAYGRALQPPDDERSSAESFAHLLREETVRLRNRIRSIWRKRWMEAR